MKNIRMLETYRGHMWDGVLEAGKEYVVSDVVATYLAGFSKPFCETIDAPVPEIKRRTKAKKEEV